MHRLKQCLVAVLVALAVQATPAEERTIAATHVYHNHMPNFWPHGDVT